MSEKLIGFPPPLLGEEPYRLKVLYDDEDIIALEKPCDVLVEAHPWWEDKPTMINGLQVQLQKDKPELRPYNISKPFTIYHLDYDTSGIVIIAKNKDACTSYRNLYGSYKITLNFHFLATSNTSKGGATVCGLPIAVHNEKPCMIVSHKSGKFAKTAFDPIQQYGKYQLWQASTTYHRIHQVRIHAFECGLNIIGDEVYNPSPKSKKHYRPSKNTRHVFQLPQYNHPHIHLVNVVIDKGDGSEPINIASPLPKRFAALLDQIKKRHQKKKAETDSASDI